MQSCSNSFNLHDTLKVYEAQDGEVLKDRQEGSTHLFLLIEVASNVSLHLLQDTASSKQLEPEVKGNKYLVIGTLNLFGCSAS